jgi:O-antigen ligase
MNLLLTFAFSGGLLGLLLKVAIVCVVVWAIWQLLAWAGITIPRPVQIILIALLCILLIYWLFQIFGALT